MALHAPGDRNLVTLEKGELLRGCPQEGLHEIDLEFEEVVRLAFGQGHLALADLVVTGPGHHCARVGTLKSDFASGSSLAQGDQASACGSHSPVVVRKT